MGKLQSGLTIGPTNFPLDGYGGKLGDLERRSHFESIRRTGEPEVGFWVFGVVVGGIRVLWGAFVEVAVGWGGGCCGVLGLGWLVSGDICLVVHACGIFSYLDTK